MNEIEMAVQPNTPHHCLGCGKTFWTFTRNGFSQAFANHQAEHAREDYWHNVLDD